MGIETLDGFSVHQKGDRLAESASRAEVDADELVQTQIQHWRATRIKKEEEGEASDPEQQFKRNDIES